MATLNLLKDIQIKQAKVKEKNYSLNDGGGLRIKITPNGNKIWEFFYTFNGKRKETTFKSYPVVTLENARSKRNEYLDLIAKNIDPIEHFKNLKNSLALDENGMFLNVVSEWLELESKNVKNNTHQTKVRIFDNDIVPFLKTKHINEITKDDVFKIIKTKEIQAPNVANKIFTYIRNLFNYAIFKGYLAHNIFSNARDEKKFYVKKQEVVHFSKVSDINILKDLVNDIYNYKGMHSIRNALKFVLHIPLRADNLCNLKWEYVDFENKILTIPRDKMKISDKNLPDFKMPLTDEVIQILQDQYVFSSFSQWVFVSFDLINPINNESPNRVLQRMGYNNKEKGTYQRLHGFRGTFRSLIETLDLDNKFSFEAKERALDHQEGNKTVRAYSHKSDYTEQLKPLMNFWSGFILTLLDYK